MASRKMKLDQLYLHLELPIKGSLPPKNFTNYTILDGATFPALYVDPPDQEDNHNIFWGRTEEAEPTGANGGQFYGTELITFVIDDIANKKD